LEENLVQESAALAAGIFGLVAMRSYPSQEAPPELVLKQQVSTEEDARVL
jgi:hypothetical protein